MPPVTVQQLAKQGDPKAIATLLNKSLQTKGITAKTALSGNCLRILLEAAKAPNQITITNFIHNGLICLSPENIAIVKLYGKRTGEELPTWEEQFDLEQTEALAALPEASSEPVVIAPKPKVMVYGLNKEKTLNPLSVILKSPILTIGALSGVIFGLLSVASLIFPVTEETPSASVPEPVPAIAPSPVQTASPVAIAPPQSTVTGIGVSRQAIQTVFEKPEVGFSFEPSSAVDGQPRVMGTSASGLATVELIGAPSELISATIMVGIPNDSPPAREQNVLYTLAFIKMAAPEWTEGSDWLGEQLRLLADGSTNEATTVFGNKRADLILLKELSFFTLTIKPNL